MPFPDSVRNEALVAAARYCCVCHRHKGVKVEVHHIIQEANGGPNTLDNAIVLCADCHTDAGHYNDRHPKGTKFKPSELSLARDRWHEIVRRGPIPAPESTGLLYGRYFICKNFEAIAEICRGDLSGFPVKNALLARTPVSDFLASIVSGQNAQYRLPRQWGKSIQSEDDYIRRHPDAVRLLDKFEYGQQWLEYERVPSAEELREVVAPNDFITKELLAIGLQPNDLCKVHAFTDGCGDVLLQEEYRLRSLAAAYLVITNASSTRVRLLSLDAVLANTMEPAPVSGIRLPLVGESISHKLPAAEIPPDTTVVLPVATILGPIGDISETRIWTEGNHVPSGQVQELSHASLSPGDVLHCQYWGPVLQSLCVRHSHEGIEEAQDVHDLDPGNLYVVDRYWEVGSCPHVFAVTRAGTIEYWGEVFNGEPGLIRTASLTPDLRTVAIVVAEIEEERTIIRDVTQGPRLLAENVLLNKGEYLVIPISSVDSVTLVGHYELLRVPPPHVRKDFERIRAQVHSFADYLSVASCDFPKFVSRGQT